MKSVAIVGGKLQGIEAVYLAKKAGIRSLLVDKDPNPPASGFCDEHGVYDVRDKSDGLIDFLKKADFILPALENDEALAAVSEISEEYGLKLAFDMNAYSVSSSKIKSDNLFKEHKIPAPRCYPESGGPYIIKPSGESGSAGVFRAESEEEAGRFLTGASNKDAWVIQEYLEGPSYSIEVIGIPGMYRTYEITEIHMAEDFDCKMVTAPCGITKEAKEKFSGIATALAEAVGLFGIMDVEVIDDGKNLKVLEIDARIPSQTPTAVYHSSGVNLLSELAEITITGKFAEQEPGVKKYTSIEHYLIDETGVHWRGERIMGEGGRLFYKENFFGADEALTDYDGKGYPWRAAFINSAGTEEELNQKRQGMLRALESGVGFTVTQKERLTELGAEEFAECVFQEKTERDKKFAELEKTLTVQSRQKIRHLLSEKRAPDAWIIQASLEKWLTEEMGFTKVTTPTIISGEMLGKMSIGDDNHLRNQVYWVEKNKCLRPMLAPNLYVMMRELHRITREPVRIFEAGSCFRKDSQGAQHLNEFTMLNLVEYAVCEPGEQKERLEFLARAAMEAVGLTEYKLISEKSEVYGETLDIEADGVELASGSYGPHKLDPAWGVFEPWVGIGLGIERTALVMGNHKTIKRVGRSITFIDGVTLNVGGGSDGSHRP